MFNIETDDKQIIKIKAYNELADYCFSKLKNTDRIFINGELSGIYVIVKDIKRCNKESIKFRSSNFIDFNIISYYFFSKSYT